ncbi:MAG: DNA polymerase III subunit delta [Methylibium sp.]|nr:DNA polymerase III subunit delta [Methylibium sp.]
MQLKLDQLAAHLKKGLQPLYTLHGDEPLLAVEAADAIRAAARAAGHSEREVHTVAGAHFDWSSLLGAASAMSLFGDAKIVEIRIPSGKPGKDGSVALQRYCERLPEGVLTLVTLPRVDRQQTASAWFSALEAAGITLRLEPIERAALPQWLAQRLAAQGQRVGPGEEGQRTLAFFADRVEGNLLAAQQELAKLALLHPVGELGYEQVEAAVLNVARYDVRKLGEAVLAGQVPRVLRMLAGLRAEGEAAVLVHWHLTEDIRALKRCKDALTAGKPLPMALRENRVWGLKERLFERALPRLDEAALEQLVEAAHVCDGLAKGLKHPLWPADPWDGLQRLALLLAGPLAGAPARAGVTARLVLQG